MQIQLPSIIAKGKQIKYCKLQTTKILLNLKFKDFFIKQYVQFKLKFRPIPYLKSDTP